MNEQFHCIFFRISHSEIERRRRNQLNAYINDLAQLVPQCRNVHSRKLDKLTILKLAVQHLRSGPGGSPGNTSRRHSGSGGGRGQCTDMNGPGSGLLNVVPTEDLLQLCLTTTVGFLLAVDCADGSILYASETYSATGAPRHPHPHYPHQPHQPRQQHSRQASSTSPVRDDWAARNINVLRSSFSLIHQCVLHDLVISLQSLKLIPRSVAPCIFRMYQPP